MVTTRHPFEILLVEDNPGDVELVREALKVWNSPVHLSVVEDGEKALRFLYRNAPYTDAPVPELILLDLNLPRKNGAEVLRDIKSDRNLALIPVIILSTSDRETDVVAAYSLHANCYFTKPLEIDEFVEKVRAIEQFWLTHVRLPRRIMA